MVRRDSKHNTLGIKAVTITVIIATGLVDLYGIIISCVYTIQGCPGNLQAGGSLC